MNNIFIIFFMIDIKPRWSLKDFESNFYNIIIIFNALINYYQVVKTSMSPSYYDHKMTIVAIIHCSCGHFQIPTILFM